jgi:hypothetical protein
MPTYTDSLRGYAAAILKRDGYVCTYCGLDGKVWPNWLYFSWDHLLPPGNPQRDNPDYIVACCTFCNTLHNRTKFAVEGKTPSQLIEQKRPLVMTRRSEYEVYWRAHVRPAEGSAH